MPRRSPRSHRAASTHCSYKALVDDVSGWFRDHPLYDPKGQPIVVPEWRFPGRGRVQGQLNRAKSLLTTGEKVLQTLPLRGRHAAWSAQIETRRIEIERALEYVELYGLYTECEAIYQVDNLMSVWDRLDDADREEFNFDPRSVDWSVYVNEVHLPSIIQHARVKSTPGPSKSINRMVRLRKQVLDPKRQVAAFDLENTLIASNVVESYSWLATRRLDTPERVRYVLRTLLEAPRIAQARPSRPHRLPTTLLPALRGRSGRADRRRRSRDAHPVDRREVVPRRDPTRARTPCARAPDRTHHRALEFVVEGLRPLFDEIVAAEMSVRSDGTYSGQMSQVPPTGEARAQILSDYCDAEGFELSECIAYADSSSDLPLFEAVGFPVAVNPRDQARCDRAQAGLARRAVDEGTGWRPTDAPDRRADGRA